MPCAEMGGRSLTLPQLYLGHLAWLDSLRAYYQWFQINSTIDTNMVHF